MNGPVQKHYVRRLLHYVFEEKHLMILALSVGAVGLVLPFIYPWIIGRLIDDVMAVQPIAVDVAPPPGTFSHYINAFLAPWAGSGVAPTHAQRIHELLLLTGLAAVTAFLFGMTGYGRGHYTLKLGNRIITDIRRDLFDHLQRLSLHFYSKERTGGIVWRLIHEVHGVANIINSGFILVGLDVAQLIIALVLLFCISWKLTAAVLLILPLYVLVFKHYNPRVRELSDRVNRHIGALSGKATEQFTGISLTKTYAAEDREMARFMAGNLEHYHQENLRSSMGHRVGAISEGLIHLGTTIIIGFGGYLALRGKPALTAGDITRFLGYVGILYGPVKRFADLNMVYQNSLSAIRRVFRVFDIQPKIREKPEAITTPPARGELRFEDVRFHYTVDCDESRIRLDEDEPDESPYRLRPGQHRNHSDTRWVLDGVSFDVEAGERVAIVGPSGSGKTTLASLLPRLYDVVDGSISIDGVDIRDYSLKTLRQAIAIVQQDSFIFSGTIRENLIYGKPDATDAEVVAAATAANAHGFIARLPDGYDTLLGERGVNLSGGQRQRLSIARALLKDPRILVLDEATSALDTESEQLVQQALNRLMQGRTCLIIAHRLSTVRNADRILALQDGRIVEAGRHDELVARDGLYARLVRHQFGVPRTPAGVGGGVAVAPVPALHAR